MSMEKSGQALDKPEVVVDRPSSNEGTLAFVHQRRQVGSEPVGQDFGEQLANRVDQRDRLIILDGSKTM